MLDKLKEMTGGDEKRMALYLSTYKNAAEDQILSMSMALEDSNYNEIRIIVHSAKPLLKLLGLDELWECANDIEVSIDTDIGLELLLENCEDFLSLTQDALNKISAHSLLHDS
jgi:HPt (histidine-containing phosphotransfer) domain-containing protein